MTMETSQSQLFCLRYGGDGDIMLRKLGVQMLEEYSPRGRLQQIDPSNIVDTAVYFYAIDENHQLMRERHKLLYEIVQGQTSTPYHPVWSWLPARIKLCSFVTPQMAGDLESTVLHWFHGQTIENQGRGINKEAIGNGDVIVSTEYKELVMNCIAARTSTTPRSNRPRVKNIHQLPNVPGIGFNIDSLREFAKSKYTRAREPQFIESEYLRKYVEENPHGALTKGSAPPMQVAPSRFLDSHPLVAQHIECEYPQTYAQENPHGAHTEGSMPHGYGNSTNFVGKKNFELGKLLRPPPGLSLNPEPPPGLTSNADAAGEGTEEAPPTPPPCQRTW